MIEVQNSEETISEREQMFGDTKVMSCIALENKTLFLLFIFYHLTNSSTS